MKKELTALLAGIVLAYDAAAATLEKGYIMATGDLFLFADNPDLKMGDALLQINGKDGIAKNSDEYDIKDLTFTPDEQQGRNHLLPDVCMHPALEEGNLQPSWTLSYTFTNTSTDTAYKIQDLRLNMYAMHKEADKKMHPIEGVIEATLEPGYVYHDGTGSLTEVTCEIKGTGENGTVGGLSVISLPTGFTLMPMDTITLFVNVTGTTFYHSGNCELFIGIEGFELTGTTITVPEPATATLSLLALAGLAARRRRK